MSKVNLEIETGPLGRVEEYPSTYTPSLLHSILRKEARATAHLDVAQVLGEDLWTGYEFSWLDVHGKPQVAGLRLRVGASSPAFVESKSLKLYLGSFSNTKFETQAEVLRTLDQDLGLAFRGPVMVELVDLTLLAQPVHDLMGRCLDDLDISTNVYERDPTLLKIESTGRDRAVNEVFHTHLFRSLCPVTGQPDWASIAVEYHGPPIDREGLLKYLISYRCHQAFHETTIEQIYEDIWRHCGPTQLSVYGRFQRRGGLDINPFRSSHETSAPLCRMPRQ